MLRRLAELFLFNWTLKLTAVVLAFLLWFAVRSERPTRATITGVQVSIDLNEEGWMVSSPPDPDSVTVVFAGPVRQLVRLASDPPRVVVPVNDVRDTLMARSLEGQHLRYAFEPEGVQVVEIQPSLVTLSFDRLVTDVVPVSPTFSGELPDSLVMAEPPRLSPPVVSVSGPRRLVVRLDSLRLEAVDLSAVNGSGAVTAAVDTTGLSGLEIVPRTADVLLTVAPTVPDTLAADTAGAASDTAPPTAPRPGPAAPDTAVADTGAVRPPAPDRRGPGSGR